jgi:hypothetical protein
VADLSSQTAAQNPEGKNEVVNGRHAWTTEEGSVVIEELGDTVLVSESLDAATTRALEREVFATGK